MQINLFESLWYNLRKTMKISIITTAFPRWENDFRGIFIFKAAQTIAKKGNQVTVVAMHNPGAKTRELIDQVTVIRPQYAPEKLEILQKDSAGIPAVWKKHPLARLLIIPFFFVHVVACIKTSRNTDIIHANWTLSGFAALIASKILNKKYILTVQGSDIFEGKKIPLVRNVTKTVLNQAGMVIALSSGLAHEVENFGIATSKVKIIPNGVDTTQFSYQERDTPNPNILYVGSLIPRKGLDFLIRSIPILLKQNPNVTLTVIGEGEQRQEYEELANFLGISDKVFFLGTQTQDEVSIIMRNAAVFCMPSLEEGQGVVFVEALASGTPCVGSRVGGIPDVISNDVGILVPPGDEKAIANAIYDLISDTERWKVFSRASRKRAETKFDWNKIADEILSVYQGVSGDRNE